jgi:exosortase/archaeosortase
MVNYSSFWLYIFYLSYSLLFFTRNAGEKSDTILQQFTCLASCMAAIKLHINKKSLYFVSITISIATLIIVPYDDITTEQETRPSSHGD